MAVYLLRYHKVAGDSTRPGCFARYYVGFSKDEHLPERIRQHRHGEWFEMDIPEREAPALPKWFHDQGIGFTVVRVWWGAGRDFERRVKTRGHYKIHDPTTPQGRTRLSRGTKFKPKPQEMLEAST